MEEFRAFLVKAIKTFETDPGDSDYQDGYLAALEEILEVSQDYS